MTWASEKIAPFLDDAVAGLADDPELRLDVRAELAAHIDEAVELHRADGKTEDEAVDLVLRSLGSPLEMAGDLQAANRGRMRMRGIARLALRGLVVPAAVIVGLLNTATPINEALSTSDFIHTFSDASYLFTRLPRRDRYPRHLDEDQRLIVRGDPTRATITEQQKAIWDRYPDDPVFFGNYLTHCLNDDKIDLEEVLQQGESLEPDNARFGYLRAAAALDGAASVLNRTSDAGSQADVEDPLVIQDRTKLEEALAAYLAAVEKPWMRRYSEEMLSRRFDLLGEPTRYLDLIHRTGVAAAVLLPDLSEIRELTRVASLYAVQLAEEGEVREPLLTAWYPLLRQYADDSFTLIDVLVLGAAAQTAGRNEIHVREQARQSVLAERARNRMEAFAGPIDAWKQRRANPDPALQSLDELVQSRGGLLASVLLPALEAGSIRPEELDANRWTEYVVMERASLAILSGCLLLILLLLAIVALACRFRSTGRSIPILMVPPWQKMLKIIGIGVVAPLILYVLYTRCIPCAGREYSFAYVRWKLPAELFLLGVTIVIVTWISARDYVRERCAVYDLAMPPPSSLGRWLPPGFLAVTWIVLIIAPVGPGASPGVQVAAAGLTALAWVATLLAAIAFLGAGLAGEKSSRLYYGTMARSMIPVLAVAILVIGWVGMPYLSASETRLIREDQMFGPAAETCGFSAAEKRLTEDLLGQIRANLAALDEQESRN